MMSFFVNMVASVAIATIIIGMVECCDRNSMCSLTSRQASESGGEFMDFTLPHSSRIRKGNRNIYDNIRRSTTEEEPRSGIFVKLNKNGSDMKESQKPKVLIKADENNRENSLSKVSNRTFQGLDGSLNYKVVPLAISIAEFNVNHRSDENEKILETLSGSKEKKLQISSIKSHRNGTGSIHERENKSPPLVEERKDGAKHSLIAKHTETNMYKHEFASQKYDEREEKTRNKADEDLLYITTQPFQVSSMRFSSESPPEKEKVQNLKSTIRQPLLYASNDGGSTGDRPNRYNHPYGSEDDISSVKKELVYEPEKGISAAHTISNSGKRFAENSGHVQQRDTAPFQYEETRLSFNEEQITRPVREDISPERNTYLDNSYSTARSHSNGYTRGGLPHKEIAASESGGSNRRYPSEEKRVSNNDREQYTFDRPIDTVKVNNVPDQQHNRETVRGYANRYETTTNQPFQQRSYSGFPEIYTGFSYGSSRQSSFEGQNVLLESPCPSVFKYRKHESDRWYADIYVTTDVVLHGMRLDVVLDKRADILAAFSVEVKSTDNIGFTMLSLKKKLEPGNLEIVQIIVKYNSDNGQTAPIVKSISLNGRIICSFASTSKSTRRPIYAFPGDLEERSTTQRNLELYTRPAVIEYITTPAKPNGSNKITPTPDIATGLNSNVYESQEYGDQSRPVTKRPQANRPAYGNKPASPGLSNPNNGRPVATHANSNYATTPFPNFSQAIQNNRKPVVEESRNVPCGLPAVQPRPLITNGQKTSRGQWPWHAAIYRNIVPNLSYTCGGSLVTNLHVITAAHCAAIEYSSTPLEPKVLLVYLGKYRLRIGAENGEANREVAQISIHPNYNATDFRADIAVLKLATRVEFTDFIRPVCLWDRRNTRIEDVIGVQGTVVGWGFDETKELTEELKQAKMPVVKHNECLWSYPDFYPKFTSNTTYCAGFKNGTSVCNGDSGGGMVFPIKVNKEERWFLRGLVSLSPGVKDTRVCDSYQYVVFTDVAKYLPWLEDLIS